MYKVLVNSIKNSEIQIPLTAAAQQLQKDFHRLSLSNEINNLILIDSCKIVIPDNYITNILAWLHKSHNGLEKTLSLSKTIYYWYGMSNDIKLTINNCDEWAKLQPNQQKLKMIKYQSYEETAPMDSVGTDLFSHAGKDYKILVDQYSGFILCSENIYSTNSANIIKQLLKWFGKLGFPKIIRCDRRRTPILFGV